MRLILFGIAVLIQFTGTTSLAAAATLTQVRAQEFSVASLRTESQNNPLGIDAAAPRLSWLLLSGVRGTVQAAYQIRLATSAQALDRGTDLLWDSGKVYSSQSTQLPYAGPPLHSRQRYYWRVRAWDGRGAASRWSEVAWWEMGLLSRSDWIAQWIAPPTNQDQTISTPAPLLRSTFELRGKIVRARAYVTSLGFYELHLNGRRVGDELFTPGRTSFGVRLQYQTYDVRNLLKDGPNAAGMVLGDGWYRLGRGGRPNNGKPFALLMQLEVTYEDGRRQTITSDASWKTTTGPILRSEIYDGDIYDARLEHDGWAAGSFDDARWSRVEVVTPPAATLVATTSPPVRRMEELKPVRISKSPAGLVLVDMGQNMAGWVRLRVRGDAGTVITLRHGEVLDPNGNLYTENLRSAEATDRYTLKGQGDEVFEPHFTFHGFRYFTVEGYPGELTPDRISGVVIHSDLEQTGTLETSSSPINQLQHNIVWSMKANHLDVPTDCPNRDERLGYGLDAQVFLPTAALNMNVASLYGKWLADLSAEQTLYGAVPMEIPRAHMLKLPLDELYRSAGRESSDSRIVELLDSPGYADAATIVPWNLYLAYGDTHILESQYQSMTRWIQYMETQAGEDRIWNPDPNLGDWLDFWTTQESTWFGSTAFDLMATAFFAHSTDLMQRTAQVLGRKDDAVRYSQLFAEVRRAFLRRFVFDDGRVGEGTQTAYVLALDFDLLPESLRATAARYLAEDVRSRGHLTTGLAGTQHLLNVLSRFGYDEEAYKLLNRKEMPSWLYPIDRGATTIWERWDGIKLDGSFQNPAMNSFNHYGFGSVGEWMFGVMAGIALDPALPGYKRVLIRPRPGGGLTRVKASHLSSYGQIATSWWIEPEIFHLDVTIPPNTTAVVTLPGAQLAGVMEGGHRIVQSNGIVSMRQMGSDAIVEVGSGSYRFKYPRKK